MMSLSCLRPAKITRNTIISRIIVSCLLAFSGIVALLTSPASAIPSPELIVGSISGLAQIGALLSGLIGGGAAIAYGRGAASDHRRLRRGLTVLLAIAAALAALNVHQWSTSQSARQAHLEATLSRPSRLPGQPQLDPNLKELSYDQQTRHSRAMTTGDAETLIGQSQTAELVLLDIRETAEVEMGTFAGAKAVRFPEIVKLLPDLKGKTVLLICHNGNRSSETCEALAAQGIDCRFMAGGLEKWITEGRSVGGFYRRSLREVRAIPPYPAQDILLTTDDVHGIMRRDGAIFVDTRYPGEFAAGHLPGAINMPLRSMPTAKIEAAIRSLPDRPVIVPCYERRSCFFGEILGLELTRRGRTFLGRYTVPWEFVVASPPPPHIVAFMAEDGRGRWDQAAEWLAQLVNRLSAAFGFVTVLAALAVLSRFIVLPFSLKAERDQIAARAIQADVAGLKLRLAHDPVRLARAIQALYRQYGMTPLRNQIALLLLPILALAVEAAGRSARLGGHAMPVVGALHLPDQHLLLPLLFGCLIGAYVEWSLVETRRHRLATWLVLVPLLVALVSPLAAASALYLVLSASLLLVQRAVVVGAPLRLARRLIDRLRGRLLAPQPGIVALREAVHLVGIGNKAHRLAGLQASGFPVPDGVVLTSVALARWENSDEAGKASIARHIAIRVKNKRFAVRSSAAGEDGASHSFAGVFETVLDVDQAALPAAIDRVLASFGAVNAASYAVGGGGQANIVVQRMINPSHAGVLFTEAPDAPGDMLVEMVSGTAEKLVSGLATPTAFRAGRITGTVRGRTRPVIDLAPLLAMARRAEAVFGCPQDIEWTYSGGQFHLVQSRDITATAGGMDARLVREWRRVLALVPVNASREAIILARTEISELLPRPTPLSLSLLNELHRPGGSVDLACRSLGLRYGVEEAAPDLLVTVFGRLYVDQKQARQRAPKLSKLDAWRLRRNAKTIESRLRDEVLQAIRREATLRLATQFDALATDELLAVFKSTRHRFVSVVHVEAEVVNICAELFVSDVRRGWHAIGQQPVNSLAGGCGESIVSAVMRSARALGPDARRDFLLREIGHRAVFDYELAEPRASESDTVFQRLDAGWATFGSSVDAVSELAFPRHFPAAFKSQIELSRRFEILKEDAKHIVLMEFAVLRRVLLAIDRRLELDGGIFQLTLDEVEAFADGDRIAAARRCRERLECHRAFTIEKSLAASLSPGDLEQAARKVADAPITSAHSWSGTRVAGQYIAAGRACVVPADVAERGDPPPGFVDGDILITSIVASGWLPYVLRSAGVVAETGGWLSHMAIIARERNIPMIVGACELEAIPKGAMVQLHLDGRIEVLASECDTMAEAQAAE